MRVLVSILILINLLIGSSLAGKDGEDGGRQRRCQLLKLSGFDGVQPASLDGEWKVHEREDGTRPESDGEPVYVRVQEGEGEGKEKGKKKPKKHFMFRFQDRAGAKHWAIGRNYKKRGKKNIMMVRPSEGKGVTCKDCAFENKHGDLFGTQTVRCIGKNQQERLMMMSRAETDASAMMEGDAVTAESASGSSSADFMLMAAGAAVGALLVAVAVAVVVAMRKRKSAKRTEMEMTEAVHVPDSSVMTPDATEKKAEGDEEAVTVHSHHAAEVTVSVSMDDEAVQVDA